MAEEKMQKSELCDNYRIYCFVTNTARNACK